MTINERLRYIREQLGLTTRSFAKSINLSCGTITNMEKGHRNITDRTIHDICRIHDVNTEWLINGVGRIFEDGVEALTINEEVKALVRQYAHLNRGDKDLIKAIMNALTEKTRLQEAVTVSESPPEHT
ncbi:helix-turn-helix domain-containing protein [Breznakiellaceae bacterium SP9]